ncbi:MAG: ACP S-malonyltransferase [Spirochaetota bacterium]
MVKTVKTAIMFPGQGAQYPGMGKDVFEASGEVRRLFEIATEVSGLPLQQLLFEGNEQELKQTDVTQIAVTLVNTACWYRLREYGLEGDIYAGFSLGELTAYHAAGIIGLEDLFYLASVRGRLMAEAARDAEEKTGKLGMAAVVGLDYHNISSFLQESGSEHLYASNDNSDRQVVLAGLQKSIEEATPVLKERGARKIIPLKVSAPFHTPLLDKAQQAFSQELASIEFKDPKKPVFTTVTGSLISSGEEARSYCASQLTSPVRWTSIMRSLADGRYPNLASCLEVGPGKALTGFWRTTGSPVSCMPVGNADAIAQAAEELVQPEQYA